MANEQSTFRADPYFDGPASNGTPQGQDYRTYQSTDQMTLDDGTPVSRVLAAGVGGVRGAVVPSATGGGIPQGTRPHDMKDTEVHIDPHIPGQSVTVRLGDLNATSVADANNSVRHETGEGVDVASMRLRGAAVMHHIAGRDKRAAAPIDAPAFSSIPAPLPMDAPVNQPVAPQPTQPQPTYQQTPAQPQRRVSPLSAFNQAAPQPVYVAQHEQPADAYYADGPPAAPAPTPAPDTLVTFEVEHFGNMEAAYHDVVVTEGFLVLVYDTTHRGSPKYFPSPSKSDDAPPMAVHIHGSPTVYLVHTTGVQFTHKRYEYCLLMVEQTGTLPGG